MNNETSTNIPFTVDFGSGVTIKKILIVGGGGGGAGNSTNGGAGGGGGGGVGIESTDITINGIYTVSIGKGGIGNNNGSGTNGENTSIYSQDETNKLEVKGGGGGGGNVIGLSGGNGGGGGNNNNGGTINTGINIGIFSSTLLKSNTGNNSGSSSGGGGGGSGVTGNTTTKNGSDGYLSDIITNSSFSEGFYYSGGGGGVANGQSSSYTGGGGGNGGGGGGWGLWNGGNGGTSININNLTSINNIGQTTADQGSQNRNSSYPTEISGGNGLKGSGGGGGGGTYNSKYGWQGYGGNGGSGILIIKYILSSSQSSPLYYHLVFDGTKWDAIDISTNFTGQHPSLSFDNINNKIGYIVVSSGKYINKKNNKYYKDTISKNININHSIPYLYLSNKVNEKCVFGVISDKIDNLNVRLENKIIINSLGEGAIWITNINGNLLNGDYITTSIIPGLGMKQDDDILHNYTVAKITMNCDFNPQRKIIQYFDKENNKYIEEITIFNDYIYDNEYLLKYIKLDGTIIDLDEYNLCLSSNISVYKMAFVGCTYHCG